MSKPEEPRTTTTQAAETVPPEVQSRAEAQPFTVKQLDIFGNVIDTYATEAELNGWRPQQGMML